MPITIIDYVASIVGDKPAYPAGDFSSNGVAMMGGCQCCYAMLAAYNAYPSTSGYWRCADCIGDTGFASVEEFTASRSPVTCLACGAASNIRIIAGTPGTAYCCGECSLVWQP